MLKRQYVFPVTVLSAARVGVVHGAYGTPFLRLRVDGCGRQQALLRLSLLQRDSGHHSHQARRRGKCSPITI